MHLLVVGAGEMGRWFAGRSGADRIAFTDRDPAVARGAAAELDGAEAVPPDTDDTFDIVCLAVPMSATPDAIEAHEGRATEAVVDVSGEMRDAVEALESHAEGRASASFHPLFSASNAPGNVPVVTVRDGPAIDRLRSALEDAGNEVFETTVEEHDRAMETVQAKAHTAVLAYALVDEAVDPRFQTALSEPLSELADGLTGNTPEVYAEIQTRFEGSESIAEAAAQIAAADHETFVEIYEEAGE